MAEGHAYLFGLGSSHGADRLGWLAAEWLCAQLVGREGLTIACLSQPVDLFLYPVTAHDRLLLVDAMRGQGPAGSVMTFIPTELPEHAGTLSSHGLDLASTLALIEALGLFGAGIHVLGIEMPRVATPVSAIEPFAAETAEQLQTAVLAWLGEDQASTRP